MRQYSSFDAFYELPAMAVSEVTSAGKADFTVDSKYVFEVGGKNKGYEQIAGLQNAYLTFGIRLWQQSSALVVRNVILNPKKHKL
ncbi:MAG: hypothetical protein FWF54_09695 [Candidatus Azobacteroides sp.]|nr:hypothetical protein [Candidatus Azobacteroides sp.]